MHPRRSLDQLGLLLEQKRAHFVERLELKRSVSAWATFGPGVGQLGLSAAAELRQLGVRPSWPLFGKKTVPLPSGH